MRSAFCEMTTFLEEKLPMIFVKYRGERIKIQWIFMHGKAHNLGLYLPQTKQKQR
jgi:hypothetical protein